MSLDIEPLTPTIGAVVNGIDLRRAITSDELFADIHAAWLKHLVLFFRAQRLSPEEHLALGRRYGELHVHPAAPFLGDDPRLMRIHTDADSHRNNGDVWHSDVSADTCPPMASILHLNEVPAEGGDTLWANMYAVLASFSPMFQDALRGMTAIHEANYAGFYGEHAPQRDNPRASHPVVRTHPETGRDGLFVNSGFTRRIIELTRGESDAILKLLFEQTRNPLFHCRFKWSAGSVAIWDNRCTQHLAIWDYFPQSRSGIRVTVTGDPPFLRRDQ